MALDFSLSFTEKNSTNVVKTIKVGCITSDVFYSSGQASSAACVNTYQPLNSGLRALFEICAPDMDAWGGEYDIYVGTTANSANKMGCRLRVYKSAAAYMATITDPVTRCFMYIHYPGYTSTYANEMYLCLPYLGNPDRFNDTTVNSMSELKDLLKTFYLRYNVHNDAFRYGMSMVNTAPLVAVKYDSVLSEGYRNKPQYALNLNQNSRGYYHNLCTYYNWHHMLTGEFYAPTEYFETIDDEKIYVAQVISDYFMTDDHLFKEGTTADRQWYQYSDPIAPPTYAWDFQSGTDLRIYLKSPGDELQLKNGSIMRLRRKSLNNRQYYYYEIVNSNGDVIMCSCAFNAKDYVGDLVTRGDSYINFLSDDLYVFANMATILDLQAVNVWKSPYAMASVEYFINQHSDKPAEFWNKFPSSPLTIAGVYMSNWSSPSSKYLSWDQRAADWKVASTVRTLLLANISGYIDPTEGQAATDLINLFSNIDLTDQTTPINVSSFVNNNGGKMIIDTPENARILWGIDSTIDPERPTGGGGSIGGGGGGSHSGGGGSYDDHGDNVGFSFTDAPGSSSAVTNWYYGALGDAQTQTNLDYLGNWLKTTGDPDGEHPFQGLGYKYSDKLANICSLKVIYSPSSPVISSMLVPKIHGQNLHGTGDGDPHAYKVTNQFHRDSVVYSYRLDEYFGSFLDYAPYTQIHIYLPFAGVHELDPSDVIGKNITIQASVDFISGDIVYNIKSESQNINSVLYTFAGNCSIDLPLTATDYSGKVSAGIQTLLGMAGVAAGIMGAGATGGASLGLAGAGLANVIGSAANYAMTEGKTYVKGSIGGTMGALSPMQCYLIVSRPKKVEAEDYASINGYPCMQSYLLKELTGYVKIADCNWAIPGATEEEIDEIDRLMKSEGAIL